MFKVGDKVRSTIDSKAMGAEWRAVIIERVSDECFITAGRWFPFSNDMRISRLKGVSPGKTAISLDIVGDMS